MSISFMNKSAAFDAWESRLEKPRRGRPDGSGMRRRRDP